MVIITTVAEVCKLISVYTGYRKDKIKEDDILVRKRLMAEVEKSGEHAKNIVELLYERNDKESLKAIKKVKDELDVFSGEVDLSTTGHQYPFFSIQKVRSPSVSDLKKLVEFDAEMLDKIVNVTETTTKIEDKVIDGDNLEFVKESLKVRQYITKARNAYKDREDFLRRWK